MANCFGELLDSEPFWSLSCKDSTQQLDGLSEKSSQQLPSHSASILELMLK
jgi:hypothetical protein